MLRRVRHENIVQFRGLFLEPDIFGRTHVFIVMEFVATTLYSVRSQLTEDHAVLFGFQILGAVKVRRPLRVDAVFVILRAH